MIGRRILVVEDEPVLVRALTDALEARGCDVISALDGERGLELALEKKPQLILLDVMLPRVNGFEICRSLRRGRRKTSFSVSIWGPTTTSPSHSGLVS
jgi:DNA-binding response OmpR family regulator